MKSGLQTEEAQREAEELPHMRAAHGICMWVFLAVDLKYAFGDASSPCCEACKSILITEFDQRRVVCEYSGSNSSSTNMCEFQLLDLKFLVLNQTGNERDLMLVEVSGQGTPFTSGCRNCFDRDGNCTVRGVIDTGIQIASLDIFFASWGCLTELYEFGFILVTCLLFSVLCYEFLFELHLVPDGPDLIY